MTRFVLISDTHGQHNNIKLPDGDILIHAGDWTASSDYGSIEQFIFWFKNQPHKHKVLICGNHETWVERNFAQFYNLIDNEAQNINFLHEDIVEINGFKIYGSPYTPRFLDWAFNVDRGPLIQKHWDLIPLDTNVLVTHAPPIGILDYTKTIEGAIQHVGCANLRFTLEKLENLKLHVFGHIHSPGGKLHYEDNIYYANASVVNERYDPVNNPIIVDLEDIN